MIFINLDFYNIFKFYLTFLIFYCFVFYITKISNKYRENLDNNYNNKINEIKVDLKDMYNEYNLFCKVQDSNFDKQIQKEKTKSKKYFQDLYSHISNDIKNNIIIANQEIENIEQKIKFFIFNNNKEQ